VEERTGPSSLASSLTVEFAGYMGSACRYVSSASHLGLRSLLLLLFGGLRGPPKPISRILGPWACPFPMRP
jgi:hypothetical protein